jgi:hypothetical protein
MNHWIPDARYRIRRLKGKGQGEKGKNKIKD